VSAAKRPRRRPPCPVHLRRRARLRGFADVYLYEQQLPRRRVAVKVMLPDRMASGSAGSSAEANVMALLSTHPAIVTIYQVRRLRRRPAYLVMVRSRPNLGAPAAAFSVAEALRVGVQVAAAVETAHRAGILHRASAVHPRHRVQPSRAHRFRHRDDGGVGGVVGGHVDSVVAARAFSDASASGVATDVYALGATVYTLLAGRSPFEQPGGRNGGADLIQRIESQPVPPRGPMRRPRCNWCSSARWPASGDRYESARVRPCPAARRSSSPTRSPRSTSSTMPRTRMPRTSRRRAHGVPAS
jgi:serine/threonine protein kinase